MLQLTLNIVLRKQSLIGEHDRQVVAECLNIWTSCITFNSGLLTGIYDGYHSGASDNFSNMLIDTGLFGANQMLRT